MLNDHSKPYIESTTVLSDRQVFVCAKQAVFGGLGKIHSKYIHYFTVVQ